MEGLHNVAPEGAVTALARHQIKEGFERQFKAWLQKVTAVAQGFEGFEGIYAMPPQEGMGYSEFTTYFKFSGARQMSTWMNSAERQQALEALGPFSVKPLEVEYTGGLDFWFAMPGSQQPKKAPAKHKMAMLTWAAVFPGVLLLSEVYTLLFPAIPFWARILCVTLTLVALLTWVIMPRLTVLFWRWIYRE